MSLFKISIGNRNYTNWTIFNATTLEPVSVDLECNPIQHKLFSGDVFTYNKKNTNSDQNTVIDTSVIDTSVIDTSVIDTSVIDTSVIDTSVIDIIHSSVRSIDNIPAVLILNGNKTFGRIKSKLLYKCIPDDTRLPPFLLPYELKHVGFSKVFSNLYVTIKFSNWTDKQPHATISQTIGPIDVLDNFYEYQLYCKSLNSSIQKFTKDTNKAIPFKAGKSEAHDNFIETIFFKFKVDNNIDNRMHHNIFSIDPVNSADFDDAFSITLLDGNMVSLSIYIANVTVLMDSLNLWPSFSQRISTFYLPDKKRPMLPSILSDCLCSLQAKSSRCAFVLDLIIDTTNNEIISTKYSNCIIKVKRNFVYEEPDLLVHPHYILLLDTVKQLSKKYKYINSVKNSHDVVCYLMIMMNYLSAQELLKAKVGIFRSTVVKSLKDNDLSLPKDVPEDVAKFVKIWNSAYGQYVDVSLVDDQLLENTVKHSLLEMDAYIHITSPIRRLVDLLNMIKLQQVLGIITLSQSASDFYDKWIHQIDYINVTMRAIKKVQNDCSLLDTCSKNIAVLDCTYSGYCFDKLVRSDGLFQYIVYLPELKLTSRITVREDMDNYQLKQYKLFLFNNEEKFKRKIRLQIHL
jgi:exoribonuclease R